MYVCVFVCVFTYVCLCQYIYVNKNDCVCSGVLAFIVKLQVGLIRNNIFSLRSFVSGCFSVLLSNQPTGKMLLSN